MTKTCIICKTEAVPGCDLSFHAFPKDDGARQQWLQSLSLKANEYSLKTAVICSKHFDSKCFVHGHENRKRRKLLAGSVPVLGTIKCDNDIDQCHDTNLVDVKSLKKETKMASVGVPSTIFSNEATNNNNDIQPNYTISDPASICIMETARTMHLDVPKEHNLKRQNKCYRKHSRVKFMHGNMVKYLSRDDFSSDQSWIKFLQYKQFCRSKLVNEYNRSGRRDKKIKSLTNVISNLVMNKSLAQKIT